MIQVLQDFHWLRGQWLLALIPLALLALALAYQRRRATQWNKLIPAELLEPLLLDGGTKRSSLALVALGLCWLLATLALAGPSWKQLPQPVHKSEQAMVMLLDLSPSMLAEDLKPSRLVRSRYKLIDLLKARKDGLTALVAYAGDAHVVTPLTDDTETIISLLPALDPMTMPVQGSQVEQAARLGLQLMADSGIQQGQLLLITDGVAADAADTLTDLLDGTAFTLSVFAIGSPEGAPIPLPDGFARSSDGQLVISKLDVAGLKQLAQQNGGRFTTLTANNQDVDFLLSAGFSDTAHTRQTERLFDTWQDNGGYLCLLLLPFAALAFRRGLILSLFFTVLLLSNPVPVVAQTPTPAQLPSTPQTEAVAEPTWTETLTDHWQALWLTPDQRGQRLLKDGAPADAAEVFENNRWKASAQYEAGNYDAAAQGFGGETASDLYNRGNALAQAGKLEDAIDSYSQALAQQPEMEDAIVNKKIVEDLLKQNQQSGNDQQQGDQNNGQQDSQNSDKNANGDSNNDSNNNANNPGQQNAGNQNSPSGSDADTSSEQSDRSSNANRGKQPEDLSDGADLPNPSQAQSPKDSPQHQTEQQSQNQDANGQAEEANGEQTKDQEASATAQQNASETENTGGDKEQGQFASENDLSAEDAQALEQWLRQVPDDPSGLLRRKFDYEHRLRQREQQWQRAPDDDVRW